MDKLMQKYKQECAIYSKTASIIWKVGLVIISILYIKLSYEGQKYFEKIYFIYGFSSNFIPYMFAYFQKSSIQKNIS